MKYLNGHLRKKSQTLQQANQDNQPFSGVGKQASINCKVYKENLQANGSNLTLNYTYSFMSACIC